MSVKYVINKFPIVFVIDVLFVLDPDLNVSAKNQPLYTPVKPASNPKPHANAPNYLNAIPARKFTDNVPVPSQLLNAMSVINQSLHADAIDLNQNQSALYVIENSMPVVANSLTQDPFV